MAKRIMVTGGAGYIGSHVVRSLGESGYDILVYDNLSTGDKSLLLSGELVIGDLSDENKLDRCIREFSPLGIEFHILSFPLRLLCTEYLKASLSVKKLPSDL